MAPSIDNSEHVRFLVVCIKHAKDGKVDFQAVADELGIVSKAAAGKRYERLLKAHEVSASKPATTAASSTTATPTTKNPASKGRKRARASTGDDETPSKKPRGRSTKSKPLIKDYTDDEDENDNDSEPKLKTEMDRMSVGSAPDSKDGEYKPPKVEDEEEPVAKEEVESPAAVTAQSVEVEV